MVSLAPAAALTPALTARGEAETKARVPSSAFMSKRAALPPAWSTRVRAVPSERAERGRSTAWRGSSATGSGVMTTRGWEGVGRGWSSVSSGSWTQGR